jgi:hypothetical protein
MHARDLRGKEGTGCGRRATDPTWPSLLKGLRPLRGHARRQRPRVGGGVRKCWAPFHTYQRVCDDCRHVHDLDSRFGGVLRLCRRGEMLFEDAADAVHKRAARLGPAGAELASELSELGEADQGDVEELLEAAG